MDDDADTLAAIRHAADAGGAAIAMRKDPDRAGMWRAISEDQGQLAKARLSRTKRKPKRD
ncbi:hypothetical protein [Caulobacter sp. S45]|uniref:hypothetical protein n=1 Tax=Caulobacter sp. S45 TaxID=1641861 RepID=UPI0015755456|nr:hypothetical protein [Caulobacter sp. S45]